MEYQQNEYTGTFIPAHVMEDDDLIVTDKMLYAVINSFRVCYASNDFLAGRMRMSVSGIEKAISRLKKKGYVRTVVFDGRKRTLQALMDGRSSTTPGGGPEPPSKADIDYSIDVSTKVLTTKPATQARVDDAIEDFKKHRKALKSPMTERALSALHKELHNLAGSDPEKQIKLLEYAMLHGWKTVYPIRDDQPKANPGGF